MVDVPEYLLKRSQERRAALSGEEAPAPTEAPATSGGGAASDTQTKTPAPVGKVPVPISPSAPPKEIEVPTSVKAAERRLKIPYWIMPVLVFIPIWAFIYVGTLEEPARAATGIVADGQHVYLEVAACSSCHGATGAGTNSGPSLKELDLLKTFPDTEEGLAQHIEWVVKGTNGVGIGRPYGSPEQGRVAGWFGNMNGFGTQLSAKQILKVVLYERVMLAESPTAKTIALQVEAALNDGSLALPERWDESITAEQILTDIGIAISMSEDSAQTSAP